MATILPFIIRKPARPAARNPGGAAIVIFPGVRYEASGVGSPRPAKTVNGGSQRQRKTKG